MKSAFGINTTSPDAPTSWSDVLKIVKQQIGGKGPVAKAPDVALLMRSLLALDISEAEHITKVKQAEIAGDVLFWAVEKIGLAKGELLAERFQLSAWSANYKRTIPLGLAFLEQEASLNSDHWDILIRSLIKGGQYKTVVDLLGAHPNAELTKVTQTRVAKAEAALALKQMTLDMQSRKLPDRVLFDLAYGAETADLAYGIVQALLAWEIGGSDTLLPAEMQNIPTAVTGADALFCSGFRWSGASAVYDFVKGLQGVGMPVTHPRIVSGGVSTLEEILDQLLSGQPQKRALIVTFTLEKILGFPPKPESLKVADIYRRSLFGSAAEREVLTQSAADLLRALQVYASDKGLAQQREESQNLLRNFFTRIALDPVNTRYTAFDSVMRAWRPEFVQFVGGAKMIAILRDPRDMYVTYVRMERPKLAASTFIRDLKARLEQFDAGLAKLPNKDACFRLVRFENFVSSSETRQELCDWLGLENILNPAQMSRDFTPSESMKNIGVYENHPNQKAIREIEKAFPDLLYAGAGRAEQPAAVRKPRVADALHVLSFSAMASKPMMEDVMSLSGRKGDAGWHIRKDITASLLAEGQYDFIGLQHTQFDTDPAHCGVHQIQELLNKKSATHYDVLNADARFGVERGDSLPIYYDTAKWALAPNHNGVIWFKQRDAEIRRIGGGRFFVYGLFCQQGLPADHPLKRVWVYNLRLRHKSSAELDIARTKSLRRIFRHMKRMQEKVAAPIVVLADTNIKEPDAMANSYLNGLAVELEGETIRAPMRLNDAFLDMHPGQLNRVTSQHNFAPAGKTTGTGRNDRILFGKGLQVTDCNIVTYNRDGNYPSYHYPVEAVLKPE